MRDDALESRLAHIEARLDQIAAEKPSGSSPHNATALNFQNFPEIRVYKASDMWNQATTLPCLGISPQFPTGAMLAQTGKLELPPLQEVLGVLERYFDSYGRYMPLFEKGSFIEMTVDWYSEDGRKELIPWAAINLVLAMTYRIMDDVAIEEPKLTQCMSNVQSVATELMAWSGGILGFQVLLGMVILFQGTTNPQLAIVLIGSAIRLAQSMGLPSARASDDLYEAAQRRRVFWIAYILDKDLALRAKAPYTQFDAETDLELPEQGVDDDMGILESYTGTTRFNYLRARSELAIIQGEVHNFLYSRTAQRLSQEQRKDTKLRIEQLLSNWRIALPQELLRSDKLFQDFSTISFHLVMNMYNRYLECLYRIHGTFAFDEPWINRARCYISPAVIPTGDDGMDGRIDQKEISSLPSAWSDCVAHSRLGLELSAFGRETEYSTWLHACCNLSGLIVLLVNIIEFPDQPSVMSDWSLIVRIRNKFDQMNAKASKEPFFLLQTNMAETQGARKRYAVVGTGGRSSFFYSAIATEYSKTSCIVALCDTNQTRMNYANSKLKSLGHGEVPTYLASNFDQMVKESKPDEVIITTMDRTHNIYIVRALELGCNVITEKPMTIDAPRCKEIFSAVERTGQKVRVTFNYRYAPHNTKVFELLRSGAIGKVTSVHFEWMLNTSHGADYFRRWHRDKRNSGGLLVHKSTHHFDLVNFWLQTRPQTVFAAGDLAFYGRENAEKRGETKFYTRAHGSEVAKTDPFALHLDENPQLKAMYLDAEHEDAYYRDQSVFGDGISIEDTMNVLVKYRNGASLSYSLTAYAPWEGFRVSFNGTGGRLEVEVVENSYVNSGGDQAHEGSLESRKILLRPLFEKPREIKVEDGVGAHGGGDTVLLNDLFGTPVSDEYMRAASHIDGAASILTGIAANRSIATGQAINVDDILLVPSS
ncbi:dehydrogenase s [Fusarium tjaetaba]|uniref:Dehydrogenase s n=1 Tax=Fusarium tjaetaba TaxID=1567544 RepID=A0A8H5S935_9HYPO|nr:dehydrogenase s [Fusarium tjaetaba]KAF5646402.1 dehydrogenase s [Fusarium tjaetaba]